MNHLPIQTPQLQRSQITSECNFVNADCQQPARHVTNYYGTVCLAAGITTDGETCTQTQNVLMEAAAIVVFAENNIAI